MSKLDLTNKLTFLAKQFDVFESSKVDSLDDIHNDGMSDYENDKSNVYTITTNKISEKKSVELQEEGWEVLEVIGRLDNVIAIVSTKLNKKGKPIIKVSVEYKIFVSMIGADPTPSKICLQWMLNTFTRFLKDKDFIEARRFAIEDLPQANEYLKLFEANKRKKKFREMAKYSLKGVKDITNINDFKNLTQLFDAVDPFIVRGSTGIESLMDRYVKADKAMILFKDRKYTVYVPLVVEASTIFDDFVGWCTARKNNSNFRGYTRDYPRPDGSPSLLYIVIDNGFFNGENENLYQVHFETNQIHDRSNSTVNLYDEVLSKSDGIRNFFVDELIPLAREYKGSVDNNKFIDILIKFGHTEVLFDLFDINTPIIRIDSGTSKKTRPVPKLPDLSRFKNVSHFVVMDSSLEFVDKSIGSLKNLRNLCLCGNKITTLPKELGNLKKLQFLNIWSNPINHIPDEIKYLDQSMGGSLKRVAVNINDVGEFNYNKLKKLLPSVDWDD